MKKLFFIIFFLILSSNANAGCDDPIADGVDYSKCKFSDGHDLQGTFLPKSNLSFAKGEEVFYQKSVDEKVLAKIVKIHYDDVEPYYTIMLPDGSEKQTIYARLTKII